MAKLRTKVIPGIQESLWQTPRASLFFLTGLHMEITTFSNNSLLRRLHRSEPLKPDFNFSSSSSSSSSSLLSQVLVCLHGTPLNAF
jgi:hypothetical protein